MTDNNFVLAEDIVQRVYRRLGRFASPNRKPTSFRIVGRSNEFGKLIFNVCGVEFSFGILLKNKKAIGEAANTAIELYDYYLFQLTMGAY